MNTPVITFIVTLFLLLAIDGIWLNFVIKGFAKKQIGHLMAETVRLGPVAVFYPLYAGAIVLLIVLPAIYGEFSAVRVFLSGLLLGLAAYGAYDLTNHATLKKWPIIMTIVDMAWGSLLTGTAATATFLIVEKYL